MNLEPWTMRLAELAAAPIQLDHIGIAVRDIEAALQFYRLFATSISPVERVEHEQVELVMVHTGTTRIELLRPTTEDSVIGRFLAKRGEGLHHIAFLCPSLDEIRTRLVAAQMRLVSQQIQTGAGGHRYLFVHPASTGGVLTEFVESSHP